MFYGLTLFTVCLHLVLVEPSAEFTKGSIAFTSTAYEQISKTKRSNFLFSPLSVQTVLALTHDGAVGATGEEIRKALHLPNSRPRIRKAFQALKTHMGKSKAYVLNSANKMYFRNGLAIKKNFKRTAVKFFDSQPEHIDFSQRQQAVDRINQWVENHTEHKIKDLMKADDFRGDTGMVLVNALHFKGNWSRPFTSEKIGDFFVGVQLVISTNMMHTVQNGSYYESKTLNAKFLKLPFKGKDVTLTVVLPNEKNGLPDLEARLKSALELPSRHYRSREVEISLPKFKFDSEIDFNEILQKIGIRKIFTNQARLTGITNVALKVDKVKQKSYIDLNTGGVEAAAATAELGVVKKLPEVSPSVTKFIADHPFLFYIKFKDAIIFAGRVIDPTNKL